MKAIALAASNSSTSINKRLVTHASEVFQRDFGAEVEILDLNDFEMPIYSSDREAKDGIPEQAQRLYAKFGQADAILISYAEHNGNYTAAWKNIFDWTSRIDAKVFQNTPMVAMSASPGQKGGASVLGIATNSIGFFGADLKGSFSVGPFGDKFDSEAGVLTDADLIATLNQALADLKNAD
ncbi:NADPH-dependent FMN reductase [Litoreibacter janthinus]|uniref:NAD(P)H-dependent FMN reductase n=1 Tax=Litoreibacter janthinus TaxID=670154 RepID=A0A1I6GDR6_9RHOB|nr:NAD(P)H-dependent oxidoreductase [Litoreibacter janthinus]SFR40353.1 NAD(P)H-dependent FMN reductase [Litoreibacter janthinus]